MILPLSVKKSSAVTSTWQMASKSLVLVLQFHVHLLHQEGWNEISVLAARTLCVVGGHWSTQTFLVHRLGNMYSLQPCRSNV